MRSEIEKYIKTWEGRCYSNGLPDEAPKEINHLVPSYRKIAMAILKNDLEVIGVHSPTSEYYGMLKSIELNKPYIKRKGMTKQELKQSVFELINTIVKKQCYIKGYGDKFRVMDKDHNPVRNITKAEMDVLKLNSIVQQERIIYTSVVTKNPFHTAADVKMPDKDIAQ